MAVFDSDFHLIQNDISLPNGLDFTSVINSNGEMLALKDQNFFGTEEDNVIYYNLKLVGD